MEKAVWSGDVDRVRQLLLEAPDPQEHCALGSPLHFAVVRDRQHILRLLLTHPHYAKPLAVNALGWAPVHLAAYFKLHPIFPILLHHLATTQGFSEDHLQVLDEIQLLHLRNEVLQVCAQGDIQRLKEFPRNYFFGIDWFQLRDAAAQASQEEVYNFLINKGVPRTGCSSPYDDDDVLCSIDQDIANRLVDFPSDRCLFCSKPMSLEYQDCPDATLNHPECRFVPNTVVRDSKVYYDPTEALLNPWVVRFGRFSMTRCLSCHCYGYQCPCISMIENEDGVIREFPSSILFNDTIQDFEVRRIHCSTRRTLRLLSAASRNQENSWHRLLNSEVFDQNLLRLIFQYLRPFE